MVSAATGRHALDPNLVIVVQISTTAGPETRGAERNAGLSMGDVHRRANSKYDS